ncbi:MAG: hypothetical protein PHV05_12990, partial [Candidatus Riflebacteria bacterium]|nr:hypothetical protein [Candidatus Riflebacteria bacterium]
MKKNMFIAVVLFLSIINIGQVYAGEDMQRIILRDRSVIVGQIVEMKNGVYTIQSDSVGQIQVAADKILEISSPSLGSD